MFDVHYAVAASERSLAAELDRLERVQLPVEMFIDDADTSTAAAVASALVGDLETFREEVSDRAPLHRKGAAPHLLDELRFTALWPQLRVLRAAQLTVTVDGVAVLPQRYRLQRPGPDGGSDNLAAAALRHLLLDGASLIAAGLQRDVAPIGALARSLTIALDCAVNINLYVSPPSASALALHHDTHAALVLQVEGSKTFTIYEPIRELPLYDEPWNGDGDQPELLTTACLEPGDVLYLPPGFPHAAVAGETTTSCHLTIALDSRRKVDCLRDMAALWRVSGHARRSVLGGLRDGGWTAASLFDPSDLVDWPALADLDAALQCLDLIRRLDVGGPQVALPDRREPPPGEELVVTRAARAPAALLCGAAVTIVTPDRELVAPTVATDLIRALLSCSTRQRVRLSSVTPRSISEQRAEVVARFLARHDLIWLDGGVEP